ncbi:MAG TPA: response regulator transcription factor [Acidimicrobiia bacterium]|nr:response regulator transcription factor [Acidimicrobiia bacterium]
MQPFTPDTPRADRGPEHQPERVWIYDTDPIFRLGIAACLRNGGFIVAEHAARLNEQAALRQGDVLLFALDTAALTTAMRLDLNIGVRLVGIIDDVEDPVVAEAVNAGVTGLLLRDDANPRAVVQCLRAVSAGHAAIPAALLTSLLTRTSPDGGSIRRGDLTDRELNVLRLLAEGRTTRAIAEQMNYSEKTIKVVIRDIMVRSGCQNRAEAVAVATRRGVI